MNLPVGFLASLGKGIQEQQLLGAARLQRETTMTLEWIANRLCMDAANHVASLLQRENQKLRTSEETLF